MVDLSNLSVLLLAGGQSRRMGQHKALLPLNGRALLGRVVDAARDCGAHTVLIAGTPQPGLYEFGVPVIADNYVGDGPLAGFEAGLAAVQTDWVLVLPCDIPRLPMPVVERLVAQWHGVLKAPSLANSQIRALVAHDGSRLQPLYGIYHRSLHQQAKGLLDSDERRVRRLLDGVDINQIDCNDMAEQFDNLNTMADYERVKLAQKGPHNQ